MSVRLVAERFVRSRHRGREKQVPASRTIRVGLAALVLTGAAASAAVAGSAQAGSSSAPVTVNLLASGTPKENQAEIALEQQFMKLNPGIKLHVQFGPYNSSAAATRAAIAAKTNVDLVWLFPGAYAGSFKSGLQPLDSYITASERRQWPLLRSSLSPDGRIYAIATSSYAYAFAYNKKLFAKASVSPPKTWNDLLAACDRLNAAGITPIAAGWKDGYYAEGFLYQFADMLLSKQQAAQWYRLNLPMTAPPFQTALNLLLQMNQHNCFGQNAEDKVYYDDLRNEFAAGKAAIVLEPTGGGPVEQGGLYPKSLGASTIGVFPPPPVPGSHYKQFVDYGPNAGWAMTNWPSKDVKAAAWKYIEYAMSPAGQQFMWKEKAQFPANNTVHLKTSYPPTQAVFKWIKWPADYTIYTGWPQPAEAVFDQQASSLMTGRISVKDLLTQVQQAITIAKSQLLGH
jgi:raffinose/stachyose/melibiose transport system substrate-binding protein